MNWTPYVAIQGQSFRTPDYAETALLGSNQFALNFTNRTATAYRGEVGLRNDLVMPIDRGSQLDLFGKIAYAHDEITNPSANANFTTFGIGGAPFIVYGAQPARNLALNSTGIEARLANGWSFMAKFDSEYGDGSYRSYSGTGRIRYTW
jgi:outer membrane autotransporter protein